MWTFLYYVFVWPLRKLADDVLVLTGFKWFPATGDAIWYTRPVREWFLRRRQRTRRRRR